MARAERPLDAGDSPLLRFAADLRRLRQGVGSPAYRELSRRAHYSTGALSDAAGGRKLPSLAVTVAYVRACDGDTGEWTRRWHQVAAELDSDADPAPAGVRAPYLRTAAFGAADADLFFGRDRLVHALCSRVAEHRLVAVVGPSGSGKSSLLRAGLQHRTQASRAWSVVVMTPGPRPLEELAVHLAPLVNSSATHICATLNRDPAALRLLGAQAAGDAELLIVVDQLEEVFTDCDPGERRRFLDALAAARTPRARTRTVVGLRADCAFVEEVPPEARVFVDEMDADELRDAITGPAARTGFRVENALVARVIADATGRPGVLPLVSQALLETWRRRRGAVIPLAGYDAAGGIAWAIATRAEAVHNRLTPRQQECARRLLIRLVDLDDHSPRQLARDEVDLDDDVRVVLERLARARLVTLDRDSVRITHEALIGSWPRLRECLDRDDERLRLERQLTEATAAWQALDRDGGALYRGVRLDRARELAGADSGVSRREREFLQASLAAEAKERAAAVRHGRLRRVLGALLCCLLVTIAGIAAMAVRTRDAMTRDRDDAMAQEIADEAVTLRQADQALAAQVALANYRLTGTAAARDGLLSAMATTLPGHSRAVRAVAISPDGRLLATGSADHTVRLWDISDLRYPAPVAVITAHREEVNAVAFGPHGNLLATAGGDGVRLWNVTVPHDPKPLGALAGGGAINAVAVSPDGKLVATGDVDHTARLWTIADPTAPRQLSVITGNWLDVRAVAFGPDSRVLATGGDDHTTQLWDIGRPENPAPLSVLTGHTDTVMAVAFAPDGHTLATGGVDHTTRLWDVGDLQRPRQLAVLAGPIDAVDTVAFDRDGHTLATGGDDRTIRLWDVTDRGHPSVTATLTGHGGDVNAVAFSPDGRTLASASDDHTAQLWPTDPRRAEVQVCAIANPTITRFEWSRYFPAEDYAPPCG